jgi:hypothetical protein
MQEIPVDADGAQRGSLDGGALRDGRDPQW